MSKQEEPVFVNLQKGPVQVFGADRRPIRVAPWMNRKRGRLGVFEVTGEHYRQVVSAKGPLFPRPEGARSAAPAPRTAPAAGDKKSSGDQTSGSDAGGKKKETPEDLSAYTVDGAVVQVAAADDVALLKTWAKAAGRKGVKEAIEKRLAELAE
jgi:hypothetical protein